MNNVPAVWTRFELKTGTLPVSPIFTGYNFFSGHSIKCIAEHGLGKNIPQDNGLAYFKWT